MLVALLTDFGLRDPYVAVMKGVISSRTSVPIHDLTHLIPPFDVWEAAFYLDEVVEHWPQAVVVCVVDPGVGSARRIIAMRRDQQLILAPDNGLLTLLQGEVRDVTNHTLFLPGDVQTFHGRDRFAPAAARLANGLAFEELGPVVGDLVSIPYARPLYRCDAIRGTIIGVDQFGNCRTDIETSRVVFPRFALEAGGRRLTRLVSFYDEGREEPFLITGSRGTIEISIRQRSAAVQLQLNRGDSVKVIPV